MVYDLLQHIVSQIRDSDHFKKWLNGSNQVKGIWPDLIENFVAEAQLAQLTDGAAGSLDLLLGLLPVVQHRVQLPRNAIKILNFLYILNNFQHGLLGFL